MNGSHIFAVNVMLGSRSVWPRATCAQAPADAAGAESDVHQGELPPNAPPRPPKSAWTRVWQRVSCLLD